MELQNIQGDFLESYFTVGRKRFQKSRRQGGSRLSDYGCGCGVRLT